MTDTELINGVPANIWNETKVPVLIGSCVFLITLTAVAIALRFFARLYSRTPLWWDDWFALATVPFALLSPIMDLVQISNGFGRHQIVAVKTNPHKLERYGFNLYIIMLFYNPGLALFKFSLVALYIRLFPFVKWLRYSCYVLAALITMWVVGNEFGLAFRCNPVKANWIPTAGTCTPYETIILSQSVPTIIFDIAILALPVRLIWSLQLARSARIGVIAVFLLGGIVTIISVIRLVVFMQSSDEDLTWGYVEVGIWSAAEPITGLLCCCLPTYAPLMRALLKKGNFSSSSASAGSRSKSKLVSDSKHVGAVGGIRSKRSYRAGYERSQDDSDAFRLTDFGDGRLVKGGLAEDHTGMGHGGIRVTQEIAMERQSRNPDFS